MNYYYTELIKEFTGASDEEAIEVEQFMRDEYSTLDGISRPKFRKCAIECYQTVLFLKTDEGKEYLNSLMSTIN